MPNVSQFNYEKIDRPYGPNLKRMSSLPQEDRPSDVNERGQSKIPVRRSNRIFSPFEFGQRIISNQTFGDAWLSSWLKSVNYKPRATGLKIDGRKGNIECRRIFVEDLNIGDRTIYVDVASNIQQAIDNVNESGGGAVILKNTTYYPTSDINLYNGVYLLSQSARSCVIDFNNQAYGIKVLGSDRYSTGTVTVANNSVIVNGAGTTWTTSMIGRKMFLDGIWYPIVSVPTALQIIIGMPFIGVALAASTYIIATTVEDVQIKNMEIKNSTIAAIKIQYHSEVLLENVGLVTNGIALDIDDGQNFGMSLISGGGNTDGLQISNTHLSTIIACGVGSNVNHGVEYNNCTRILHEGSSLNNHGGDGIRITNCEDLSFQAVETTENGSQGIELVSGNTSITMLDCSALNNASDGIKLTASSNYCDLLGCRVSSNGGYGINIAAASCNKTEIDHITAVSNTAGTYQDLGTSSVIGSVRN